MDGPPTDIVHLTIAQSEIECLNVCDVREDCLSVSWQETHCYLKTTSSFFGDTISSVSWYSDWYEKIPISECQC